MRQKGVPEKLFWQARRIPERLFWQARKGPSPSEKL